MIGGACGALIAGWTGIGATAYGITGLFGYLITTDDTLQYTLVTVSYTHLDVYKRQPGHSIADRTGVADLERNFMDPQQGWRKEKSRQRRAGT